MDQQQQIDYIQHLLHRMAIHTDQYGNAVRYSADSVSWNAYREAEQLKEEYWIDIVDTLLQQTKTIQDRKHLFFIWSHLTRHTTGTGAVEKMLLYFTSSSPREQMALLPEFARVPFIPDATPFLALSYAQNGNVRREAIEALGCCDPQVVGERIIELLSKSKDDMDIRYTLLAIQHLHLDLATPYLIPHLRSKKVDIRSLCIHLLSLFDGTTYLSIFEYHLSKDLSIAVKWSAMEAISKHGTEAQVKLVLKRVKAIVSRPRAGGGQYPISELMYGIDFLQRVASHDPVVDQWLQEIRTSQLDKLFEHEQLWLAEQYV